jgi:hypothetical protein
VMGVSRTAQGTVGSNASIVSIGKCAGVLSGATAGVPYYLGAAGGISSTPPSSGNQLVRVGYAMNATDLWVEIQAYGKRA